MLRWTIAIGAVFVACATRVDSVPPQADPQEADRPAAVGRPARTKAEDRLDTRLRAAIDRERRGEPIRAGDGSGLDVDAAGRVLLDLRADVTAALIAAIERSGGLIVSRFAQFESVRARIALSKLVAIAERDEVTFIRAAESAPPKAVDR
jgi:hypothetical protein